MKKIFTILMALMALCFTQCKPTPENGEGEKVKIRCEIPISKGSRSDFTNLLTNGRVNWSNGRECVYLAVHGNNPQIIELESHAVGNPAVLTFEGEVESGLINPGEEYDVWYFGHSNQAAKPNYELIENRLEGSVATQSGRLENLGYNHIAMVKVIPTLTENEDGDIILSLIGTFKNKIAILLVDLENADELYGDAILGTEYTLAYNSDSDRYELNVTEDANAKIKVQKASGISYVALFPNSIENTEIRYRENQKVFESILYGEIKANKFYYKTGADGSTIEPLPWVEVSSGDVEHGNHTHHYVDLGLPSGTLWATRNVGADTLYEYGDYFAWGEIETKDSYTRSSYKYCEFVGVDPEWGNIYEYERLNDIAGKPEYDAATAIWGPEWKMPTHEEQMELYTYCKFEAMKTSHGTNGYLITGPNGSYIFLPAAGYRDGEYGDHQSGNYFGHYWSSTQESSWQDQSFLLHFESSYTKCDYYGNRYYGCSIRPVLVKKRDELDHNH